MTAKHFAKGIWRLRLASCMCTHPEILQYTPAIHLVKVHKKTKGRNYKIEPSTPRPEPHKEKTIALEQKYDIWLMKQHGQPMCTIEDALTMHMEYADPSMLNNMDGFVYANLQLDMTTRKKTKFLKNVKGMLEYPNEFDYGSRKTMAIFCFTPEDMAIAEEFGALYYGGEELVKQIVTGAITKEAITSLDLILATPDNIPVMNTLRSMLKDQFPRPQNNTMDSNLRGMLEKFSKGIIFKVDKLSDETGTVQLPLGKMSQGLLSLVENFEYMVEYISALKTKSKGEGAFIQKINVIAPPSHEQFEIKVENYVKGEKVMNKYEKQEELPEDTDVTVAQAAR